MGVLAVQDGVDWLNRTNVHWLGALLTSLLAFAVLVAPRRWVPSLLIAFVCFVPPGQRVVVMTLDFSFMRILILSGWVRMLARGELLSFRARPLDVTMLAWVLVGSALYVIQRGSSEGLIFKAGVMFDALGLYFLFRSMIRSWGDLDALARSISFLAIPVMLAFVIENLTSSNAFSIFGAVPEVTDVREGRLRCQGAFAHPILAGAFWASLLPLVFARCWQDTRTLALPIVASACAIVIVLLTASSTPYMVVLSAVMGGLAFVARRYIRWGLLAAAVTSCILHLLMTTPVWHLIARVNVVGGSTGWHRFLVIDETIRHFREWWLVGVSSTEHWGTGLGDITNQFVLEAVNGGLAGLLLFLCLIVQGFLACGRGWRGAWPDAARVAMAWGLGVSLFAQCVSFLGVAHIDQSGIIWYLVLASLASIDEGLHGSKRQPASMVPTTAASSSAEQAAHALRSVAPTSAHGGAPTSSTPDQG